LKSSHNQVSKLCRAFLSQCFLGCSQKEDENGHSYAEGLHAREGKPAAMRKIVDMAEKLKEMKLHEASRKIESSAPETLAYMNFPREHWRRIRSNNAIERLNQEIRRETRSIGAFQNGQSALMLVYARHRHME